MATTYLALTNTLLNELNENELRADNFQTQRGLHKNARNAIRNTVDKINVISGWPFNAAEHTRVLEVGVSEYAWPLNFVTADWRSFQIQATESTPTTTLQLIDRDEWYKRFRDMDYTVPDNLSFPKYVFESHGNGFGVSHAPDQAYTLKFRYYRKNAPLVAATDLVNIPDEYTYIIILGAMWYMNMFKENKEGAAMFKQEFDTELRIMKNNLINRNDVMRDTRIVR